VKQALTDLLKPVVFEVVFEVVFGADTRAATLLCTAAAHCCNVWAEKFAHALLKRVVFTRCLLAICNRFIHKVCNSMLVLAQYLLSMHSAQSCATTGGKCAK
jgi:hypothetical protein